MTKATILSYLNSPWRDFVFCRCARASANMNAPIAPDFNFSELGIGGLDNEFQTIFRRAFASRVLPLEIFREFGVRHVKGTRHGHCSALARIRPMADHGVPIPRPFLWHRCPSVRPAWYGQDADGSADRPDAAGARA